MKHKCDGCRYKGEHQEMGFRPFGVCTKELNLRDAEAAYNSDNCPYQLTNGDMIRAKVVTDEGLAELLVIYLDDWGEFSTPIGHFEKYEEAIRKTVEWLRRPAEDFA